MSDTYKLKIRPEKVAIVEGMKEKLSSEGVVLIAYDKLDVATAMKLRRTFLKHGVEYKVCLLYTSDAADELTDV